MSIKTNLSDFIDIANLPNLDKKISELILGETKMISTKIGYYEMMNTMIKGLFDKIELEKVESSSSTRDVMEISPPSSSCKKPDISLKPQKDKQVLESCSSKISFIHDIHSSWKNNKL